MGDDNQGVEDLSSGPEITQTSPAPVHEVSRSFTAWFSLIWMGLWMAQLAPIQLVIPNQLDVVDHLHKVRDLAFISGGTGLISIILLPVFGAWCDRTRSRYGRRTVWVVAGGIVTAVGLLSMGWQGTWEGLGLAWLVATLGYTMESAALTAVIADRVPDRQRGKISAAVYGQQAVGLVLGLAVLTAIDNSGNVAYVFLTVALAATGLPFVLRSRETAVEGGAPSLSLRAVLGGLWVSPSEHPDFAWAFGGRALVNMGNALGTTYLFYFLQDYLKVKDPDATLLEVTLVYLLFTLMFTYGAGIISDRSGRRKIFVAVASTLQALAAFDVTAFPTLFQLFIAAALLGAGYGAYMAVDQALITAVLPDAETRAKDLGIMNIGASGPSSFAPFIASVIISGLGGYRVLFASAGVATLIGTVMVRRVRSVR